MNKETSCDAVIQPLGHASPDRYQQGAWPTALLERMAYWVKKFHAVDHSLLDIGCGEGALLHKLGFAGFGIDLNAERLNLAKERKLNVMMGDGTQLPFENQHFSTVVSMEVLEHVPDMTLMMRDVHRVLINDGVWIISVPNVTLRSRYEMWREKRPYYCDADEHYREITPVEIKGFEHRFMLTSEFLTMFRDAGFDVCYQDGVRYLFPQWFSRIPLLHKLLESPAADRFWSSMPWFHHYPYWMILVLRKRSL